MNVQQGFTAVEVLVTLVIATLLVGGSYQAYSIVINNTAAANDRSLASNQAYNALRSEVAKIGDTCVARTATHTKPPGVTYFQTEHTCPYGTSSSLTLVTTTIISESGEIKHAILAS